MHHHEAVSSRVINSFLAAGRPMHGTRMTAKELLARRNLARRSSAPITPDFFTPNPRRTKGKYRAEIGVPLVEFLPDELKQECARTWLLNTVFWERFRFQDLDRIVFTYPVRLPRHCTPARAIPSSQRRYTTPRHLSPRTHSPPRPRLFSDSASQYAYASSSTSTSHGIFHRLEELIRPFCTSTPDTSADPDKAWEAFLSMLEVEDVVIPQRLKPPLLMFATRLASGAFTMASDSSSPPAEEMSSRAAKVRKVLEAIKDSTFPPRQQLNILDTQCATLEGRFEEVEVTLDKYCTMDQGATPIIQISQAMIQAIDALEGPEAAYDWLVSRWGTLERYLWSRSSLVYSKASRIAIAELRDALASVMERIEFPGDFLTERIRSQPDGPWKEVGEHFVDVLCGLRLHNDALEVMRQMTRLAVPPSIRIKCVLVKALAKGERFDAAHELYGQMCKEMDGTREPNLRELWTTGLYLHAMQGHAEEATEVFTRLKRRNWVNYEVITSMLHATAVKGLVKSTTDTFDQLFPPGMDPSQLLYGKPTKAHYTEVLYAHAQAGDMDRVHGWLKRMMEDDITPDDYTYSILVKGFGSSGDITSLSKLMEKMKVSGVKLNLYGYTTVISFLARSGDSVEAERTYRQALRSGIKPDIKMLNALMYAHVQSGFWRGVVDVFGYIKALPGKRYRPTTPTYNTLLKAFVLIGAPFSKIRDLVVELEAIGTRPDVHTFAILVQSACDHKEFDAALGLLGHMDKLVSGTRLDIEVTIYVLTILMGSFLRHGDKVRAREMYEQLKSRSIVPSAITYSGISYAYAQEKTDEMLTLAEAYLGELISEESSDDESNPRWISISGGRSLALDTLYQPLMHVYAGARRVEDVERLQQELLDRGARMSLGGLAALLTAYRNCGDVEAGKQTWSLIYDMASQRSKLGDVLSDGKSKSNGRREVVSQSNILCIPLSIYIDLLSSTGNHAEVARVWEQVQTHGFTFDSHNWNHLVIALIRAGEPERAFAIMERVILPNTSFDSSAQEAEYGRRSHQPNSPLSIVGGNHEVSLPVQDGSPVEAAPWAEASADRYNRRMEGVTRISKHLGSHPTLDINAHGDFAQRLETLQLIPFTWNSWRPHPVTLSVLSHALTRLASGRPLRPIQDDSGAPGVPPNETTPTPEHPIAILNRIYTNHREAVKTVREFERRENERDMASAKNEKSIRWK